MRRNDHMAWRFIAVFLASVLAYGNFGIQVALGVEATGGSVDVAEKVAEAQPAETESAAQVEEPAAETEDESQPEAEAALQAVDNPTPVPAPNDDTSNDGDPAPAAETQQPYDIKVTFGDDELAEGENNLTDVWTTGTKRLNVQLTRNKTVNVDPTKQYVLCMSVPDTLFFSGLAEASKINGVEDVKMIQNTVPRFNTTLNSSAKYPLSSYSGQMRLLLNTSVKMVTIADLDVLFDPQLLGYSATDNTTIADALNIRVVAVDASEQLDKFTDDAALPLVSRKIDSLQIKNGTAPTTDGSLRMRLSTDGFNQQSATNGKLKLGRSGNITYVLEAAQKSTQAYKKLTVVLSCPYIWVDADGDGNTEKHYLSFDKNSDVLRTNRLTSSAAGFNMAKDKDAVYDPDAHTITYTFENLYIAAWQMIAVTPQFSWPSDLDDSVTIPENGYQVYFGDSTSGPKAWTITDEQTYCGTQSVLLPVSHNSSGSATFINDGVNLTLKSSAEDVVAAGNDPRQSTLGKRVIYKEVTRAEGVSAGLGYFDLHNEGVTAAPLSRITFEFNTDPNDGATYYVNRVNIPLDGNTGGTDIEYTLVNGAGQEISDTKHVNNTSSFSLYASSLVNGAGSGEGYYFKKISYTTSLLRAGAQYHSEVTHSKRNFIVDYGLYFGYIEGNVGDTAHAKMTIESLNGTALNTADATKLESTETTWVGNDDSVYLEVTNTASNRGVSLDGASSTSQSITAGGMTTLSFRPNMTNAEDQTVATGASGNVTYMGILNGCHTVRNPIVYVCLPKGVSIAGPEQASALISGKTTKATSVRQLVDCTYEGVDATWWEVRFDGASMKMASARFDLKLSTSLLMSGVTWNFEKAVAFRADGQALKGTSTTTGCSPFINNIARLRSQAGSNTMLQALATAFESDPEAKEDNKDNKLGLFYYTYSVSTVLNIARAEAKLDVDTKLSMDTAASRDLKVTNADSEIDYEVNVNSTDGGSAKNFKYYIPVAKQTAKLDANSFVVQQDYDLKLMKAVEITELSGSNADIPFKVLYTTMTNLDSAAVAELPVETPGNPLDPSAGWVEGDKLGGNFDAVTAILIKTTESASVGDGSHYRFNVTLGYDNTNNDFASQAGRSVVWRSFGHYTYNRNGAETTNTYPSRDNSVKLGYVADYTGTPIEAKLDTAASDNLANFANDFDQTFKNAQTVTIKGVRVSDGTTLTHPDPSDLTGSDANSTFRMALGLNSTNHLELSKGFSGGSYAIPANTRVSVTGGVRFSRALTDTTTDRYVDVVLGNDDIDVTVRIKLNRIVAPASVDGSGTVPGENFQAVTVSEAAKTIAFNAAFTALYDVKNFVPGNFTAQKLVWKSGDVPTTLPKGTNITMMKLGSDNKVQSWWLYTANGTESAIDLKSFKRMSGSDSFTYDTDSTSSAELKYQFVVSLPPAGAPKGSYKLGFAADAKDGVATFTTVDLPVVLGDSASFSLDVSGQTVNYAYSKPGYEDTRNNGKLLALVLTPRTGSKLPADAKVAAAGASYARNASGDYIIPLGTAESGQKSVELGLVSDIAAADGTAFNCSFDVSLREFAGLGTSPMAGLEVGAGIIELAVSAGDKPALKVTGNRVAKLADWTSGKYFKFEATGVPDDATVTVTAYQGLSGSTRATDVLSNIGGFFDVNAAVGTWKSERPTGANELRLSSATKAGTYRLIFEVKRGNDVLLTVPYYIVVRE